jgi:hypothetical protein
VQVARILTAVRTAGIARAVIAGAAAAAIEVKEAAVIAGVVGVEY